MHLDANKAFYFLSKKLINYTHAYMPKLELLKKQNKNKNKMQYFFRTITFIVICWIRKELTLFQKYIYFSTKINMLLTIEGF